MNVRPLGHRIHVKPDATHIEQTTGGIIVPDAYADVPSMSGTVIALGSGPERDLDRERRVRALAIKDCIDAVSEADDQFRHPPVTQVILDNLGRMLRLDPPDAGLSYDVKVGDRVIFPMDAGHEVVIGEDAKGATVILTEDSILAVVEPDAQENAA